MINKKQEIKFPQFSGLRCLMMPYIQGDFDSVPDQYKEYKDIIENVFIKKGDVGFLTIDESRANAGKPHRGKRAKCKRALHTEAGLAPDKNYIWGGHWGTSEFVKLDRDVKVLLANNLDDSCAIWDKEQLETTLDGDIGHLSDEYSYDESIIMKAGEVYEIGIFNPHESLPVKQDFDRQFLRIISSGVHGREPYFTENPKMKMVA